MRVWIKGIRISEGPLLQAYHDKHRLVVNTLVPEDVHKKCQHNHTYSRNITDS